MHMDIALDTEIAWLLIIETYVLLVAALAFLGWRYRRLRRRLAGSDTRDPANARESLLQGLQQELDRTRSKFEQAGTNTPEAERLHQACEFRIRVLENELRICAAGDDEHLYWQQIIDYFDSINRAFNARLAELQFRLRTYLERINNLEGFKAQVFSLAEKLRKSRDTIQTLEEELARHLPAEQRSAELEAALQNIRDEKQQLEDQLSLVENEYETLMKNIEVLQQQSQSGENTPPAADVAAIQAELDNYKEENEFLCNQIAVLLKQELYYENNLNAQREKLEGQVEAGRKTIKELEAKLAETEKKYLELLESK